MIILDPVSPFTIDDPVYGYEEVGDPVLVDILNSECMARIKGINQYGPPRVWYHTDGFSRFDHCVGTMILLRRLGATIEEQVAGLLHDASHYAFSHVADWVLGSVSGEDNADIEHGSILRRFGVERLLLCHGIELGSILGKGKYLLLEQPAPALCADRIDYTLREVSLTHKDPVTSSRLAASLRNVDGRIVFDDSPSAIEFAMLYLRCNESHWAGPEAVIRYNRFSYRC
ncbi:MAG: HD domain-containing protein [Nanoarchaeota archaeon]